MTDKTNNEEELSDAFDENASSVVQTILLMRIYDMLVCIGRGVNPYETETIFKGHAQGKIFGPAPSFDMGDEVSETDEADEPTAE
jgi:hypothetical protein